MFIASHFAAKVLTSLRRTNINLPEPGKMAIEPPKSPIEVEWRRDEMAQNLQTLNSRPSNKVDNWTSGLEIFCTLPNIGFVDYSYLCKHKILYGQSILTMPSMIQESVHLLIQ